MLRLSAKFEELDHDHVLRLHSFAARTVRSRVLDDSESTKASSPVESAVHMLVSGAIWDEAAVRSSNS